jgi:hypothetical protein
MRFGRLVRVLIRPNAAANSAHMARKRSMDHVSTARLPTSTPLIYRLHGRNGNIAMSLRVEGVHQNASTEGRP